MSFGFGFSFRYFLYAKVFGLFLFADFGFSGPDALCQLLGAKLIGLISPRLGQL